MYKDSTRIAVLEQRLGNVEDDVREIKIDVKEIAVEISKIRQTLAEGKGMVNAVKYLTHSLVGFAGVAAGYFGLHKG